MKVKYVKKPRPNDFKNSCFTFGKEYDVLADYRLRKQWNNGVRDNGFVIKDDTGASNMVFIEDVEITDNSKGNTYVFAYNAE